MTTFSQLTKTMLKTRVNLIHKVFGVYLLVTLVTCFYQTLIHGLRITDWLMFSFSFGVLASLVLAVILAVKQERVWTAPLYRLLPLSETKLYVGNVLTNFFSWIYFEILVVLLTFIMGPTSFVKILPTMNNGSFLEYAVGAGIILIFPTFIWCSVSLVHLLTNTFSDFLPINIQRISRVVLIIVLVYGLGKISNLATNSFTMIFASSQATSDANFYLSFIYLILTTIVVSIINIYLLKNWAQATPKTA